MNNQCQCHKAPCICGTGLCNDRSFPADSAKIETIDENGQIHYVESIYQKISLNIFENMECCVTPTTPTVSPTNPPDNDSLESGGDSILNPIVKQEEKETSIDCTGCCEQIYSTSLPNEKHECKNECNITAELYCQIKRQNSEPGEKISECSTSSSSEDSEESDEEIIGDGSVEFVSAQGRSEDNEYNSEATLEDEDSFNLHLIPQRALIEETNGRIDCENKSCCPLDSPQKCKHSKLNSNSPDEQNVPNKKYENNTSRNISGDSENQNNLNKAKHGNEEISNETKWTTLHPESSRQKKIKKLPIQLEKLEASDDESEEITEIKAHSSATNILDLYDQNLSSILPILPEIKSNDTNKENTTAWKTIVPEDKKKFSGQSWKRKNVGTEQNDTTEVPSEIKNKNTKHVSIPEKSTEDVSTEIQYIAKNRKRKYESLPNEFANPSVRFERSSSEQDDFYNTRETRKSFGGRKRRVTLSNFVTEEQLKEDIVPETVLSKPVLKPELSDAFFLLDKSVSEENKRQWNTYVPCERSDFNILPENTAIKKLKQALDAEKAPAPANIVKNDPRQSFIRQKATPFKPTKFLCFKYIPNISPQTSSTSSEQQNLIDQIAIDPPDSLPLSTEIPKTKIPSSRIPVAQFKHKVERKPSTELEKTPSSEARSNRRQTLGLDELRNVLVQRNPNYRRSIIPPEYRKSVLRRSSVLKKNFVPEDILEASSPGKQLEKDSEVTPASIQRKKNPQQKQVVLLDYNDEGSDTSLRNKMKNYYSGPIAASTPIKKVKEQRPLEEKKGKEKVPLSATTSNRPLGNNNGLQKTCCSQTGIHVCVKESVISEKGREELNILQMVNIDVTPKNSKFVKVNVMPTVPEINKEGIITIPVQFRLCSDGCKEEMQKGIPQETEEIFASASNIIPKKDLLYQEIPENNWHEHYMEQFIIDKREDTSPQDIENKQEEPYVNLLWTKMKDTLSEPKKEENSVEIQTDLVLGQKLLSKSLNSLTSNDSSSSVQNKSEPVKRSGIDWNDILLPPPGSFVIKKMPIRKAKRRFSADSSKIKDNNMPSTSGGLPPTEEIKNRKEQPECAYPKNKLKCCCSLGKSHEEPYVPANKKSSDEKTTTEEITPHSDEDSKTPRSKVISLVFSESFYDIDNYSTPLQQTLAEEEKLSSACTSKPEIPWNNILLPTKPQIRKIEKLDISKTSTTITDQTFTDEYNSMSPSPKTTDTCPNLSDNSAHTCDCNNTFTDKGTNTSIEEDCETVPESRKSNATSNMSTFSTEILKAFKEDPVLSAFKAFEEELKPVRKALAEVQSKLRALNIPELECIFKKDPISEYAISRSNSQIGQNWEYKQPYFSKWSAHSRSPSRCFCRTSEQFDYYSRPPEDCRFLRFATPPMHVRSRNLSTDIWKSFGSCDRNTIKCPYEKMWTPTNFRHMRNADSYQPYSSAYHESRNSTPGSDLHYMPVDPLGVKTFNKQRNCPYLHNMFDKRVDMINDDEDLDYPSTYRNTPTHPHHYSQPDCYCDSEDSLYSNATERINSNHVLANFPPKYTSSFHSPTTKGSKKYMPIKVRPVTHYYLPIEERHGLQNPKHISTRNTSINLKNGKVYARTKIELPRGVYKRINNVQKNVKKIYPQPNDRNYSQSEYDGFNRQNYDCACEYSSIDDNLPVFSNCYKEYLKNERYA